TASCLADVFDPGDEVTDLAGTDGRDRRRVGHAESDFFDVVHDAGLHKANTAAGVHRAVDDAHRADDAAVLVVVRVGDQSLQRCVRITNGCRYPLDDSVEQLGDPFTGLGRDVQDLVGRDAEYLLDLTGVAIGIGSGQVDLVERGDDREVVLHRQQAVGE